MPVIRDALREVFSSASRDAADWGEYAGALWAREFQKQTSGVGASGSSNAASLEEIAKLVNQARRKI